LSEDAGLVTTTPPTTSGASSKRNTAGGAWGSGVGLQLKEYTLLDGDDNPAGGVGCWCTSDAAGLVKISPVRITNSLGKVVFQLDVPAGTHVWIWYQGATAGDEEVV